MGASAVSLNWLYDWRASGDDTLPTSNYHTFIITPAKAGAHAGIDPALRRETRNRRFLAAELCKIVYETLHWKAQVYVTRQDELLTGDKLWPA